MAHNNIAIARTPFL